METRRRLVRLQVIQVVQGAGCRVQAHDLGHLIERLGALGKLLLLDQSGVDGVQQPVG